VTEGELWLVAERVMTAKQFTTFWLHYHEGFTVIDLAKAEKLTEQAIRARLKLGTRNLLVEKARLEMEEAA
jgi:predicted DNA-binding protein YlxM (UPF0122 family)